MPFRLDPALKTGYEPAKTELKPTIQPVITEPQKPSFPEKVGKYLGIEPLGRGIGLSLARLTPEIRTIERKIQEGTASPYELEFYQKTYKKEAPISKEVIGGAASTFANLLFWGRLPGIAKTSPLIKNIPMAEKLVETITAHPLLQQSIKYGTLSGFLGASEATAEGENIKGIIEQGITGAAVGAAMPPIITGIGKGIGKIIKTLPSIFTITTTGQKKAFEFQLKNPQLAKTAVQAGKSFSEITDDAIKATKIVKQNATNEYIQGTKTLIEKYPKTKVKIGNVNTIFNKVGEEFDISISKTGKLLFQREGRISSIATGPEQKRIQEIYSGLKNWKDFSSTGSAKLLHYLNKLKKFETTLGTKESVFVNRVLGNVRESIFKQFPEIQGLLNNYSVKIGLYENANKAFKALKGKDALSQTTAVQRIMRIFDQNKEPLYRLVEQLEKESGISILKELSAAELSSSFPPIIRSVLGIGALTQLINPTLVVALPLFIQRSAAAITRGAGRLTQVMPSIEKAITPPATYLARKLFKQ